MSLKRSQSCTCVVDGKILVLGGAIPTSDGKSAVVTDIIEEYDPITNKWRVMDFTLPDGRSTFGCSYDSSNQSLMIFGGWPIDLPSYICSLKIGDKHEWVKINTLNGIADIRGFAYCS
jgi:N-acetylneuraminic acid mutarotase